MTSPTLDEALARIPAEQTPADRRVMVEVARQERALWETREDRAEAKRVAAEANKKARAEEREVKKKEREVEKVRKAEERAVKKSERERVAAEKKAAREAKKKGKDNG